MQYMYLCKYYFKYYHFDCNFFLCPFALRSIHISKTAFA
uniref:Uncharacterized protein n=1 Tax=Amphimedon queenslandica TaxID=400682 RepID=A0A1X7VQQ0_AMPQE